MKLRINTKPISMNSAYPTGANGRRFLSREGKAYKELIGWEAKSKGKKLSGPLRISYTFGFADNRRRDTENFLKITTDALTGIWFDDDSQIIYLEAQKVIGNQAFVEIEVKPY